ncbi:plasmid partitioning protein RepB [Paracoccus fontiphilus]|uniref:Plasmid partitioning protein RepB n=1 Tax=Paracoccus fontiphilus TaxID=1815556 RepID=A0ABV7IJA0_9RHOB|nr:plasmid partitioning protein RepB [Paracoccus fontiphilus]
MSDSKKRRMSMLDNLAQGAAGAPPSMMSNNRALRSARDAVDSHRIWELDPDQIVDDRAADRMDPQDVADLRASIEAVGQTVPILVRRDPSDPDRYLLVYGRRRLEAVRGSDHLTKIRAMIASMDDGAAIRAQASENTGRRELSFIERAMFARQLVESEFGSQAQIADILNVTKSAISMSLSIVRNVGPDLASAIGPAHGTGRPRWEALAAALAETDIDRSELVELAARVRGQTDPDVADPSVAAFDAVIRRLRKLATLPRPTPRDSGALTIDGKPAGKVVRTKTGVRLEIRTEDMEFAEWLQSEAAGAIEELHARWKKRG